jgi:penicillin-binding protein 2
LASTTGTRRRVPRRFLPPDPSVEAPYRLSPQVALRIGLLGAVALAVFGVLFLRLWALQVLSGTDYLREAQNNQLRTIRLEARRGAILDREGRVLVDNRQETVVRVWPADLPRRGAYQELKRLAHVLRVPLGPITRDVEERRGDPVTPVIVKSGANERLVDYLEERHADFRGVDVVETNTRQYPRGMLGSQLFGYVGEITRQELDHRRKGGFRPGDRIGQTGLEASYDAYLRGRAGLAELRVDSLGKPRSTIKHREEPVPGNSLRTTIDFNLQQTAERSLQAWVENARHQGDCFGCWSSNGGAIVALDPSDGSVLALASYPRYNPRLFTGRVDARELVRAGLTDDPKIAKRLNYPGLDRAIQGVYPAGSTFKPVTALAAMQEHLISPYTELQCTPAYWVKGQRFNNWNPDVNQPMALAQALEASCDTFFYQVGMKFYNLPPERRHPLQEWARRFGFGRKTGIDIGSEVPGLLPTPEWRKAVFKHDPIERLWKPGDSIQLAIGQKDLQVTPLQMARFYAMIANGGKLVTPHLGLDIEQPSDRLRGEPTVLRRLQPPRPKPTGVDPAALAEVQRGLLLATHGPSGTSTAVFGTFPVAIAGKTGTAEKVVHLPGYPSVSLVDQSWWCGYGPVDPAPGQQQLVVCALIENAGHGGTAAAPAALSVFQRFFHVKGDYGQLPSASD